MFTVGPCIPRIMVQDVPLLVHGIYRDAQEARGLGDVYKRQGNYIINYKKDNLHRVREKLMDFKW